MNSYELGMKHARKRLRRKRIIEARIAIYGSKSKPSHGWKTIVSPMDREIIIPKKTMWQRIEEWLGKHYK